MSNNHVVAMNVHSSTSDDCFEAQVDALLATDDVEDLAVTAVLVDPGSARNTILDSGTDTQVVADRGTNAVRATPTL